jgi:hypothetical protein
MQAIVGDTFYYIAWGIVNTIISNNAFNYTPSITEQQELDTNAEKQLSYVAADV